MEKSKGIMEAMVRRAQTGDKEVFVELMEAYKGSLLTVARAILQNEEDVADALQETVLAAFEKLWTLKKPQYCKTWLTRILINNCYTILRQKNTVPLNELLPEACESAEAQWDDGVDVNRALARTGGAERLILTLYYVEDMSQREIAKAMDISENAVKQRLARSRKRLRESYLKGETVCEGT